MQSNAKQCKAKQRTIMRNNAQQCKAMQSNANPCKTMPKKYLMGVTAGAFWREVTSSPLPYLQQHEFGDDAMQEPLCQRA